MTPAFSLTIPSLYDGTLLDCRVYQPSEQLPEHNRNQGAIVAHPYAALGGCYDDAVVLLTVGELLRHGLVVGTFNFRCVRR